MAFHFKQHGAFRPVAPIHGGPDIAFAAISAADERRCRVLLSDGRFWPDGARAAATWEACKAEAIERAMGISA